MLTFARQAKPCALQGESPCWIRLSQPSVSSRIECCVRGGVGVHPANKTDEAYTENRAGRSGNRVPRKLISLRNAIVSGVEGCSAHRNQHKSIRKKTMETAKRARTTETSKQPSRRNVTVDLVRRTHPTKTKLYNVYWNKHPRLKKEHNHTCSTICATRKTGRKMSKIGDLFFSEALILSFENGRIVIRGFVINV